MEAVFLQPILKFWFDDMVASSGNSSKYLEWLSDYSNNAIMSEDLVQALNDIDPTMCSLLQHMLVKNPTERCAIAECLVHPWFLPLREQFLKSEACSSQRRAGSSVTSFAGWLKRSSSNMEDSSNCKSSKACSIL